MEFSYDIQGGYKLFEKIEDELNLELDIDQEIVVTEKEIDGEMYLVTGTNDGDFIYDMLDDGTRGEKIGEFVDGEPVLTEGFTDEEDDEDEEVTEEEIDGTMYLVTGTDSGYTDSEENSDTSPIIKNKNSQRNGHFVTLNEDIVKAAKADELADKIIKEEELEIEKRIEEQKRKQLKKLKDQRKKNEERLKRERKEKAKKEEIRIMNEKKEEEIRLLRQKREEENQKRIELSLKIERENRIKENIEIFEYFAQKIKIDSDTNKKREAFNRLRSNPMNLINKVKKKKKKKKKGMISSNQNDSDQFISGEKNPLDTEGSPTDSSYSSESDQISTISDQNSYIGTEETVKEPLNRIDIVDSKDYKATKLEHLKYHLFLFFQHEKEKNNIDDNTEFKNFLFESENNLEFWKNNNTKELDNNLVDTLIKYINSQRNYQSTDGY